MQNIFSMRVDWPITDGKKHQYIQVTDESRHLLVPSDRTYVILRRFSAIG